MKLANADMQRAIEKQAREIGLPPAICPMCGVECYFLLQGPGGQARQTVIVRCPGCEEKIEVTLRFKMVFDRFELVRVV